MESFWIWLTSPPANGAVLDAFAIVYALIFAAGFLGSAYCAGGGAARLAQNTIQFDGIRHWANVGLGLFGPGLFFFVVRVLQINPLSFGEPIWLVGSLIALAIGAVRCVHWWRTTYPLQLGTIEPTHAVESVAVVQMSEERLAPVRARRS